MAKDSSILFSAENASVVATVGSPGAWRQATTLTIVDADFLEIRLDLLCPGGEPLPGSPASLLLPLIFTVRSPEEGGRGSKSPVERASLYQQHLAQAAAIDIELAAAPALGTLLNEARARRVACILSFHDFHGMPSRSILGEKARLAADSGADLFKVAATANTAADLVTLLEWTAAPQPLPIAAMGMGRLGKVSRPLLAQLGSRLNYGFLDAAVAPGQWPAAELRQLLNTLDFSPSFAKSAAPGGAL